MKNIKGTEEVVLNLYVRKFAVAVAATFLGMATARAASSAAGQVLLEPANARASALGEAYAAGAGDLGAMQYNPASLNRLPSSAASFSFAKGMDDDYLGRFLIGGAAGRGSVGLSVARYDAGEIDLFDGTTERTVTAQSDTLISATYARTAGVLSYGFTGKYLSSTLIESEQANAYAFDLGVQTPLYGALSFGAAVQNIGTGLRYVEEKNELPTLTRAGFALSARPYAVPTTLLLDASYLNHEQKIEPSLGFESRINVIALRAGYKMKTDGPQLSAGIGLFLGASSLDYSFRMVSAFESRHDISCGFTFGPRRDRF